MEKLQIAHQFCAPYKIEIAVASRSAQMVCRSLDAVIIPHNPRTRKPSRLVDQVRDYSDTAVIVYLLHYEEAAEVVALSEGVEDVLNDAMSTNVIAARLMSAVRRRLERSVLANIPNKEGDYGLLAAEERDPLRIVLLIDNTQIILTSAEARIIQLMLKDTNRIVSHATILNALADRHARNSSLSIFSHMKRIRVKFRTFFPNEDFIHSIYGLGYRLSTKRKIQLQPIS
jgi:two-component system response regulator BaeR